MPSQNTTSANRTEKDTLHDRDDWQAYAAHGSEQVRGIVRDNAGRSVLVALGAGLGVGFLIGSVLGGGNRSSRWWDRSTAEGIGHRLLNKIEGLVPKSVSDHLRD